MSKRKQDKVVVTLPTGGDELYEAAKHLALKMLAIEQDPDIISVFSIARAHGYKVTSKFWYDELQALGDVLRKLDEQRRAAVEAAKEEKPEAPVEPFPAGGK